MISSSSLAGDMKKKRYLAIPFMAFLGLLLAMTACSPSTFGQLSDRGKYIFFDYCHCHSAGGAGAPTLGATRLGQNFQNAEQVYNKIRATMPYDLPGALAASEYQQVLSYILLQNGFVGTEDTFDVTALSQITFGE